MNRLKKLLKKIDEIVENISIEEIDERIKIDEEEGKAMLSKEEIETCKEELLNYIEFEESIGDNAGWARGLKWHIEQLEKRTK